MAKDDTNYEELADRAERGDLQRRGALYQGDGSEIDLAVIFVPGGATSHGPAGVGPHMESAGD